MSGQRVPQAAGNGGGCVRGPPLTIAFVHVEMCLGGAEQLVVLAAKGMQAAGHRVRIYTAGLEVDKCFDDLTNGALDVHLTGAWLPKTVFNGRCRALCSTVRMLWLALVVLLHSLLGNVQKWRTAATCTLLRKDDDTRLKNKVMVPPNTKWNPCGSTARSSSSSGAVDDSELPTAVTSAVSRHTCVPGEHRRRSSRAATDRQLQYTMSHTGSAAGSRSEPHTATHSGDAAFGFDCIFVDQVATANPILKLCCKTLVFYCHHPDHRLAAHRRYHALAALLYRVPMTILDTCTMTVCDAFITNSRFTAEVAKDSFFVPYISERVQRKSFTLYPPADLGVANQWLQGDLARPHFGTQKEKDALAAANPNGDIWIEARDLLFVSLNRYEAQKNHALAIRAFSELKSKAVANRSNIKLIIAGGYRENNLADVACLDDLKRIVMDLGLSDNDVKFLQNVPDFYRWYLLRRATCVLYTPEFEHFGIVPVEAMSVGTPVIACDSGGPTETVVHGQTGYLCAAEPALFADAMSQIVESDTQTLNTMRLNAITRVTQTFAPEVFAKSLVDVIRSRM